MQLLEIKIQCACGSRFAFDVQPIHGRMPSSVLCPRCGCDHTEQANLQIARSLAPPPLYDGRRGLKILNLPGYNHPEPEPDQFLISIPQPGIQTLPVGGKTNHTTELDIPITDNTSAAPHLQHAVNTAMAASQIPIIPGGSGAPAAEAGGSTAPSAPAPGGLRVRPSKKSQTTTVIHPPVPPLEGVTPTLKHKPARSVPASDDVTPRGIIGWIKAGWKIIFPATVTLLVVLRLLRGFGVGEDSSDAELAVDNWNFGYEDTTQIYVKVDDAKRVTDACVVYWAAHGKTLTVKEGVAEGDGEKEYLVTPAHHGYVAILGPLQWDVTFVDGLAGNLSSNLNTIVMTFAESDFSGAHRFAVYHSGQKSFSHQYDVQISGNQIIDSFKVEGESWAVDNGYFKPDGDGFKNFEMPHINLISQQLGLQWWTFPEQAAGFHTLRE